jgi:hypothetical protein
LSLFTFASDFRKGIVAQRLGMRSANRRDGRNSLLI